jgi:hypothetical protein
MIEAYQVSSPIYYAGGGRGGARAQGMPVYVERMAQMRAIAELRGATPDRRPTASSAESSEWWLVRPSMDRDH